MNSFMQNLTNATNIGLTANGAYAHKSTNNPVYDLFAMGGAYRQRSDADCILLFKNAFEYDANLALKCLFYLSDCRGGQGERRFFRVCYNWLANNYPTIADLNMKYIPEYRRWDDVIYSLIGTPIEYKMINFIKTQLNEDITCKTPSLLGKWMPSENASSAETKRVANIIRTNMGISHKQYRKLLSTLRQRINIVERLMSENRWDEIEFDKIPSKAGIIYKNAFARRDIIAKKYETFAKSSDTKVNAATLYPYDVVNKAATANSSVDRAIVEKYWNNLPDYLNGAPLKMMCVVDTSGSMTWSMGVKPIDVAISLGMYCAERIGGPFKDHFITFSRNPQLIKFEGVDFVDKVKRVIRRNECSNTDLLATFALLRRMAKQSKPEDVPETIVVISDMQIDSGSYFSSKSEVLTEMESERIKWEAEGLKMPHLVYWNVNASDNNNILDAGPNVSYVSGCSPVIFKQVITGKTGWDLCLDAITAERYANISVR